MKLKGILLALASVAMLSMFSGCALIQSKSEKEINLIEHAASANYEAYGVERMDVLGLAATTIKGRCSAVDFFKFVTNTYPTADDMINVRMEEISVKKGSATSYSCTYSGLAVAYTSMTLADAKRWQVAKESKVAATSKNTVQIQKNDFSNSACVPCACVTCGCQPCANINSNNYYTPNN